MDNSRIVHFLSIDGFVDTASSRTLKSIQDQLNLGRFRIHFEKNSLPELKIIKLTTDKGVMKVENGGEAQVIDISLWILAPDGSTQLVIETIPSSNDADSLSAELGLICFNRTRLTYENENLLDYCHRRVTELGLSGSLDLGSDVHQFVLLNKEHSLFYSEKWPKRLIDDVPSEIIAMSYRESSSVAETSRQVSLRIPIELNRRQTEICAHGRGVTVLGGHDEATSNTIMYTASKLLFGLARTRLIRRELLSNLNSFSSTDPISDLKKAHARASNRSRLVREHGLHISTEIESLIDGLTIPEMVIDSYRISLKAALDLEKNLAITNRLLERVTSIVESQREDLSLNLNAAEAINQSRWSAVVSGATAVTLPLALLFSYFGISEAPQLLEPIPWLVTGAFVVVLLLVAWRVKVRNSRQFKSSLKEIE
jgi:hypothetical protein